MRLMWHDYDVIHVAGKNLVIPDTLFRSPLLETMAEDQRLSQEIDLHVNFVIINVGLLQDPMYGGLR